jgi:hypothetical protein
VWESKVVSAQCEAVTWWDRQGWDICHREFVARTTQRMDHGEMVCIFAGTGRLVFDDSTTVGRINQFS